jgi:hypothetical protein
MGLNLNKGKKDDGNRKTKIFSGNTETLLRQRQKELPRLLGEVEELFDDWNGGTVCIVMNTYDENNNAEGAKVCILGVDDLPAIVAMTKAIHSASHQLIEQTIESVSKDGSAAMMALVAALIRDIKGGEGER